MAYLGDGAEANDGTAGTPLQGGGGGDRETGQDNSQELGGAELHVCGRWLSLMVAGCKSRQVVKEVWG